MKAEKILFIDRDGTLVEEPVDFQVDSLDKICLYPAVIPALLALVKAGFKLVMVTNQDNLGTPCFPQEDFQRCQDFILNLLSSQGISFTKVFICPHSPEAGCTCRKPLTGLVDDFIANHNINIQQSWVIGDRASDEQLAKNLNLTFLPVSGENNWLSIANTILNSQRSAYVKRQTKETCIEVNIALDTLNKASTIATPIDFFSHMLEQIATHAGCSLELHATGDVTVDDHHLIEDSAIALGEAIKQALGDKWGIARYGFTLPMDESLATIALDLSGRPFCDFQSRFTREYVGGMATEMVPHFFKTFAQSLGATIHVQVSGENHHHMIEACFKALGRTLRQAFLRTSDELPSTKGIL